MLSQVAAGPRPTQEKKSIIMTKSPIQFKYLMHGGDLDSDVVGMFLLVGRHLARSTQIY